MFSFFKKKDKLTRKEKTEKFLKKKGIKINFNLPNIEDESGTILRNPKEIAQRVSILAVVNMVAFNNISGNEAIDYLKKYELWDFTTNNEKEFLDNPTDQKKTQETWKCECIWTLMWALNKVENLEFPDTLCDLNDIPFKNYPIGQDKDPNVFINSISTSRTATEILDQSDLYYRMNWACVDARLNGLDVEPLNPGVVYERQYALNWLVNYMNQDWDDVTCDT